MQKINKAFKIKKIGIEENEKIERKMKYSRSEGRASGAMVVLKKVMGATHVG